MPDPLVSVGVALGIEVIKQIMIERRVADLAAKANVSSAALEQLLTKTRVEFDALRDPNTLMEV